MVSVGSHSAEGGTSMLSGLASSRVNLWNETTISSVTTRRGWSTPLILPGSDRM